MSATMSLVIGIIIGSFTAMILIVIIVLKVIYCIQSSSTRNNLKCDSQEQWSNTCSFALLVELSSLFCFIRLERKLSFSTALVFEDKLPFPLILSFVSWVVFFARECEYHQFCEKFFFSVLQSAEILRTMFSIIFCTLIIMTKAYAISHLQHEAWLGLLVFNYCSFHNLDNRNISILNTNILSSKFLSFLKQYLKGTLRREYRLLTIKYGCYYVYKIYVGIQNVTITYINCHECS